MKKTRKSTFETNSSSVHSLVFCSEDEYKELKNNQLYIDNESNKICTFAEAKHIVIEYYKRDHHVMSAEDMKSEEQFYLENEHLIEECWDENRYCLPVLLENWLDDDLESEIYRYTSKSGDKIVAITQYGHD